MIEDVKIPEISENVESGVIVQVLVEVGDMIDIDDVLVEFETEKALVEIPSTVKGKITELLAKKGDEMKVGDVIARVDTETRSEDKDTAESEPAAAEAPKRKRKPIKSPREPRRLRKSRPKSMKRQKMPPQQRKKLRSPRSRQSRKRRPKITRPIAARHRPPRRCVVLRANWVSTYTTSRPPDRVAGLPQTM